MAKGPAITREEAVRSIEIGIEVAKRTLEKGYKVLAIGEMGIANTTPTSAIISVFAQCEAQEVTGKGAGLSPEGVIHKAEVIKKDVGECPVCLLDDVMSELDPNRQNFILNHIKGMQTFLTCCDPSNYKDLKAGKIFTVENGRVI